MKLLPPEYFYPELTSSRLSIIATALLDIRYDTITQLQGPYDDNYVRETAAFGRSRNRLIELCRSGDYEWLDLRKADMDITFTIGRVPCRFFRDDPIKPDKPGFFKRNPVDDLFETDETRPVMWRFVVEAAATEDDEDRVFFIGYNALQEKVSEWAFDSAGVILHSVDRTTPQPVRIPFAELDLIEDEEPLVNQQRTGTAPAPER